jgi:hypothetical protein
MPQHYVNKDMLPRIHGETPGQTYLNKCAGIYDYPSKTTIYVAFSLPLGQDEPISERSTGTRSFRPHL